MWLVLRLQSSKPCKTLWVASHRLPPDLSLSTPRPSSNPRCQARRSIHFRPMPPFPCSGKESKSFESAAPVPIYEEGDLIDAQPGFPTNQPILPYFDKATMVRLYPLLQCRLAPLCIPTPTYVGPCGRADLPMILKDTSPLRVWLWTSNDILHLKNKIINKYYKTPQKCRDFMLMSLPIDSPSGFWSAWSEAVFHSFWLLENSFGIMVKNEEERSKKCWIYA